MPLWQVVVSSLFIFCTLSLHASLAGCGEFLFIFWVSSYMPLWQVVVSSYSSSEWAATCLSGRLWWVLINTEWAATCLSGRLWWVLYSSSAHCHYMPLWQVVVSSYSSSEWAVTCLSGRLWWVLIHLLSEQLHASLAGCGEFLFIFWVSSYMPLWQVVVSSLFIFCTLSFSRTCQWISDNRAGKWHTALNAASLLHIMWQLRVKRLHV